MLDPIDGTVNFARGSPLCTISLSLVLAGDLCSGSSTRRSSVSGSSLARRGAYVNGHRITVYEVPSLREAIVAIADFKVGPGAEEENRVHLAVVAKLAHESLRVRMLGSAALDLAWLAAGRLNATLMLSNLPWDVTAGLLLVREAGGCVYDHDGSTHTAGSRYTIASVPSLVDRITRIVTEAM